MVDNSEINGFIDEKVKVIRPMYNRVQKLYFTAAISGKKEDYDSYEKASVEFEKIFNNKEDYLKIKGFLKEDIKDLDLKRQLKILYDSYLGSQGDIELIKKIIKKSTNIDNQFNTYRANVFGKSLTDNQIREALINDIDSSRLNAYWEASKKQGELVVKELIEVIKLRNQLAKSLGFSDYHELRLEINEQTEEQVEKIFDNLDKLTEKPFEALKDEIDANLSKRYKIKKSELMPWHYQDLFFQEGPMIYPVDLDSHYKGNDVLKISEKFYSDLGFDVKDILSRSDLFDKPNKYQHACCMDMDKEGDVRIIESVTNNEHWMSTSLHELGHAIYSKHHDFSMPYLFIDAAHIFTTEAIAMLFGRETKKKDFIEKYTGNKVDRSIEDSLFKSLRLEKLVFSRWSQVMFRFERELYKNPDQDLNKLWWDLVKRYQLMNFSRDKPDWASKIHFVSAPVYYHNYLLGELLASQINAKTKDLKGLDKGKFMKDKIFSIGRKYRWDEMIKRATGEELNPEYFVKEFVEK